VMAPRLRIAPEASLKEQEAKSQQIQDYLLYKHHNAEIDTEIDRVIEE